MDDIQEYRGLRQPEVKAKYLAKSGYHVANDFVSLEQANELRLEVYSHFLQQTRDYLIPPNDPEYGQVRSPFLESKLIRAFITSDPLTAIAKANLIGCPIFHLVNGQVVVPDSSHNQSKWHKDLNKAHISFPPLAINCLLFLGSLPIGSNLAKSQASQLGIQDFLIVPRSHLVHNLPNFATESFRLSLRPGTLLIFNSLLWHRVVNMNCYQFFLNIMYTEPFVKQQIFRAGASVDWIQANGGCDSDLAQLLGFWSQPPASIQEFRNPPGGTRSYRANQG
jgi:hypothetical protein